MKYYETEDLSISRFSLGTVQLGLSYGVANGVGKPSREEAHLLLNEAVKNGVTSIDTASVYGDSEEVIGSYLEKFSPKENLLITTKICDFDFSNELALETSIRNKVADCKRRLGLPKLPILMLHHFSDFEGNREKVLEILNQLKQEGEVGKIGISLYEEDDFYGVANSSFDAVQLAQNIFDWRLINSGKLKALSDAGKIIFVRSVFLQGLIFKKPEEVDEKMAFCVPTLRKFYDFCKTWNMAPAVLAASFVLSLPGVASLVLGCETIDQVKQNTELINQTVSLSAAQMEELKSAFSATDPRVLDPREWNKA